MKTILLIHGPNLNFLGRRDAKHYGLLTLKMLESKVRSNAKKRGFVIKAYQSNYEGALIDFLQKHSRGSAGIVINPGALTHYSYVLYDALIDANLPAIEVHLSDVKNREKFRKISVTARACRKVISGKKLEGYLEAIDYLAKLIK